MFIKFYPKTQTTLRNKNLKITRLAVRAHPLIITQSITTKTQRHNLTLRFIVDKNFKFLAIEELE